MGRLSLIRQELPELGEGIRQEFFWRNLDGIWAPSGWEFREDEIWANRRWRGDRQVKFGCGLGKRRELGGSRKRGIRGQRREGGVELRDFFR